MKTSFRKANINDAKRLAELRVFFLNEISNTNQLPSKEQNLKEELYTYFKDEIAKESIVIYIAEQQNEIIATSTMVLWKAPIGYDGIGKNGRGYILNMFTLQAYRKKGIGRILLNKLIDTAKEMNLENVHLHATKEGLHLYKSEGFIPPYYEELEYSF